MTEDELELLNELHDEDRKDKAKDSAKSGVKAAWAKWRKRGAKKALQAAVKAGVAASVAGGLVVSGIAYNNLTNRADNSSKAISALQAQNSAAAKDLPGIRADIAATQAEADQTKQLAGSTAADVNHISAKNNENSQRISAVSAQITQDSKTNDAKIAAVQTDMADNKIQTAAAKQQAQSALDQAASNQSALVEQAQRVDGVAAQVTDLATKEQATAKAAGTAQATADGAASKAQAAADSAASARTVAETAQTTANEALAKANDIEARLPIIGVGQSTTPGTGETAPETVLQIGTLDFSTASAGKYVVTLSLFMGSEDGCHLATAAIDETQAVQIDFDLTADADGQRTRGLYTSQGVVDLPAGSHHLNATATTHTNPCPISNVIFTVQRI